MDFFLCCGTQPVIESSKGMKFGCYQYYYPELKGQWEKTSFSDKEKPLFTPEGIKMPSAHQCPYNFVTYNFANTRLLVVISKWEDLGIGFVMGWFFHFCLPII